jgi:hypothetical protein
MPVILTLSFACGSLILVGTAVALLVVKFPDSRRGTVAK